MKQTRIRDRWPFGVHGYLFRSPPERPKLAPDLPRHRRLRVYTQDPSIGRLDGAVCTLEIPNEPLAPGPAGAWFVVQDGIDKTALITPVLNLEEPAWLMRDGVDPSTTDGRFTRQMVYAVAMETYHRFTRALGRDPGFGPIPHADGRLRIVPKAFRDANAYYDRDDGSVQFGWDVAGAFAGQTATVPDGGRSQPGSHVFIALSRDVIAHEISHALLDGLRPNFMRPTHPDVAALHEGFADLVAIFLHFSQPEVVAAALDQTQGYVDPLADIGRQFGYELLDGHHPLRTAVHSETPDDHPIGSEHRYDSHKEVHDLGAVFASAVFEAYRRIFQRKTGKLRRALALYQNRLPSEGVDLLASEACKIAEQFLDVLIRAVDYCPSHHCSFGEFLRAMITADFDLVPEDTWAYREALVSSFRRFGITVPDVQDLSEAALRWQEPTTPVYIDALRFETLGLRSTDGLLAWPDQRNSRAQAAEALGNVVCTDAMGETFGLARPAGQIDRPRIMSLRTLRRISPDGRINFDIVAEIVQKRRVREGWFFGGATLVIGADGLVRYAIAKNIGSERRLKAQRAWLKTQDIWTREAAWADSSDASASLLKRIHRKRQA